jgi:hypothetical protein
MDAFMQGKRVPLHSLLGADKVFEPSVATADAAGNLAVL